MSEMAATESPKRSASRGGMAARWLQYAIAAAGIALGLYLIHRTLSNYTWQELVDAVTSVPAPRLAWTLAFSVASYGTLSLFDYLALRYAGAPLSYPKAALASFVALSLGHTIGFAALSSGAVRYRYYKRWGLDVEAIAKVILFCGATVGLGLVTLAGIGLTASPHIAATMVGFSPASVRLIGAGTLLVPLAYLILAWRVRTPLQVRTWRFEMPSLPMASLQIVVGTANFALVAACLYQALIAVAQVSFADVVSAYVAANTATLVTHVPGGLGVMETVVQHLIPGDNLIGALLIFRFAYFLAPLALGACLLVITEGVLRRR